MDRKEFSDKVMTWREEQRAQATMLSHTAVRCFLEGNWGGFSLNLHAVGHIEEKIKRATTVLSRTRQVRHDAAYDMIWDALHDETEVAVKPMAIMFSEIVEGAFHTQGLDRGMTFAYCVERLLGMSPSEQVKMIDEAKEANKRIFGK